MSLSHSIWPMCFPPMVCMNSHYDVCMRCEQLKWAVMSAAGEEEEKLMASEAFAKHVHEAQEEHDVYNDAARRAHPEYGDHHSFTAPPYEPFFQPLKYAHCTFDFAQQATLPHMFRQPVPLCFITLRNIQLLGVCSEGVPKHVKCFFVFFLFFWMRVILSVLMGKKSWSKHSCVTSNSPSLFSQHGHGEEDCVLHADNCAGKTKTELLPCLESKLGLPQKLNFRS